MKQQKLYIKYDNKIIKKFLRSFYEELTVKLPKKLVEKNYPNTFNLLKSWDLVKTFPINSYKLKSDLIHLLEQEQFDGN